MKKLVFLGALMVSSSIVLLANRSENVHKHPNPEKVLEKLDADKDGKISKEEAKGRLLEHFSRVDGDGDGFVTLEELKAVPRPERDRGDRNPRDVFTHLDANGDELISKEEAKGPLSRHFDKFDANKDGIVSLEELENAPKPSKKNCEKDCPKSCERKSKD